VYLCHVASLMLHHWPCCTTGHACDPENTSPPPQAADPPSPSPPPKHIYLTETPHCQPSGNPTGTTGRQIGHRLRLESNPNHQLRTERVPTVQVDMDESMHSTVASPSRPRIFKLAVSAEVERFRSTGRIQSGLDLADGFVHLSNRDSCKARRKNGDGVRSSVVGFVRLIRHRWWWLWFVVIVVVVIYGCGDSWL